MRAFRSRLGCLLAALMISTGVWASESQTHRIDSRAVIHATPSGSYFTYDSKTFFLPGVHFSEVMINNLLIAGSDVVYRKLMHYFLQLTLEHAALYLSRDSLLWYTYSGIPYALGAWNLIFNVIPKGLKIAGHSWEKAQTSLGWRRRGRMPVYVGGELDKAVFIDFLLHSREGEDEQSQRLEITPLQPVNPDSFTSSWHKAMGNLVNSALENDVDLIRITAKEPGNMQLEWHKKTGKWVIADTFYAAPSEHQDYLTRWLEYSWGKSSNENQLFSVLEPAGLNCMSARFSDRDAYCTPLSELVAIPRTSKSRAAFQIPDDKQAAGGSDSSSFLHVIDNRSLIPGAPGDIVISGTPTLSSQDHRHSSIQYRVPRELTYLAEYMVYQVMYQLMDVTVGSRIEQLNATWHGRDQYTELYKINGGRINGSIHQIKDKDGRIFIRKEAPMYTKGPPCVVQRFAYLSREVNAMRAINGRGAVKLHDTWLENAGSRSAKLVVLVEDGGRDISKISPSTPHELKSLVSGATAAVENLHRAGYAHFDIKPENLVVNNRGQVKLIDLETVVPIQSDGSAEPLLFDQRWMPPEFEKTHIASWRSDIWNLGATALSLFSNSSLPGSQEIPSDVTGYIQYGPGLNQTADAIQKGQKLTGLPAFADFIRSTLNPMPEQRWSASNLRNHPFLN